jgi:alkylation response protein AidB-like acyl-CoA dehydrogenase
MLTGAAHNVGWVEAKRSLMRPANWRARMGSQTHQAEERFRADVRSFVSNELPVDIARRAMTGLHTTKSDQERWGRILNQRGWSAPSWPEIWGGQGWSARQLQIFDEECYLLGAPEISWNGIRLVGPVIYTFASDALKKRFLPPTLAWDIFWGQGFSEPDAGSDLASLKTRADREGGEYVVNGSKIWMTDGHFADWLFCLVRTSKSDKKQAGISFLLIEANSPGVEITPIPSIDGQHTLNQVFFTDVRVPVENLVGEEGSGWSYAKFLLANERTSSAEVPRCKFYLQRLRSLAQSVRRDGRAIGESPHFAYRLAVAEAELIALEQAVLSALEAGASSADGFARASVLKLKGSHLLQSMGELMVDAISEDAAILCSDTEGGDVPGYLPGITADFLYRRASTIYGGSAEVQRNIIAATLLGA